MIPSLPVLLSGSLQQKSCVIRFHPKPGVRHFFVNTTTHFTVAPSGNRDSGKKTWESVRTEILPDHTVRVTVRDEKTMVSSNGQEKAPKYETHGQISVYLKLDGSFIRHDLDGRYPDGAQIAQRLEYQNTWLGKKLRIGDSLPLSADKNLHLLDSGFVLSKVKTLNGRHLAVFHSDGLITNSSNVTGTREITFDVDSGFLVGYDYKVFSHLPKTAKGLKAAPGSGPVSSITHIWLTESR